MEQTYRLTDKHLSGYSQESQFSEELLLWDKEPDLIAHVDIETLQFLVAYTWKGVHSLESSSVQNGALFVINGIFK
jgi:hypothetical protein